MSLDVQSIRSQFPALNQKVNGYPLVYLDNAASTLRVQPMIDAVNSYYSLHASNVHRGAHYLSAQATGMYESARSKVAKFLNATTAAEIIFTKGTTESLNMVAQCYAGEFLNEGDEILLSEMEHHSNIVPWQVVAQKKKLKIKVLPVDQSGDLDQSNLDQWITPKTKMVSLTLCSNTLGTMNDLSEIIRRARLNNAMVCLDAAQFVSSQVTDVQALGCDFLAFSGHKLFGPNGIGVLYGREELLNKMPPYQTGGSMISKVSFAGTEFLSAPQRFEAGTPNVAGAIGLGAAIDFVNSVGLKDIDAHEKILLQKTTEGLQAIPDVQLFGLTKNKASIVSFAVKGIHHSDVGSLIDKYGIAVRVGHHCTQPLMECLKVPGTVRASLSIYNTLEEIDEFIKSVKKVKEFF